jgi:hypothetical protein
MKFLGLKIMCLWASYEKKIWKKIIFFASLKGLSHEMDFNNVDEN